MKLLERKKQEQQQITIAIAIQAHGSHTSQENNLCMHGVPFLWSSMEFKER